MTHADKGKYFQKHPGETKIDDILKQEIEQKVKNNNISCRDAEEIGRKKGVTLSELGVALDMLNINIIECQLGLFGYETQKRIVKPAKEIADDLKQSINDSLKDGRLPCSSAWTIATKFDMPRIKVCAACEAMQIKIKPCQLGAF
jgi:hypothetical protein